MARPLITKGDAPVLIAALDGPINWTGFSIGASAGGLWSQTRQTESTVFVDVVEQVRPHVAGMYAGGQVGADYQFDRIVVGVAGDAGFTNARGGRGCSTSGGGYIYSCQSNIDALYMARARIGYATERSLFYVKGGAAFADTKEAQKNNFNLQPLFLLPNSFPNSAVRASGTGWTAGAGFEFAITKTIPAKAEYMHYELDRKKYAYPTTANQAFLGTQNTGDIVKVGVNYRFGFEPGVTPASAPVPVIAKY